MEQHEIGTNKDLVIYRLGSAKEDLKAAKALYDISSYKAANNRAYYAIFHTINAIHALNGKAYKRHKDALANFNKEYIKTEIFPKSMGKKISGAEEIRHASDYDDFYVASDKESKQQIVLAEELISMAEQFITGRLSVATGTDNITSEPHIQQADASDTATTVEDAEAAYIKSISENAHRREQSVSFISNAITPTGTDGSN